MQKHRGIHLKNHHLLNIKLMVKRFLILHLVKFLQMTMVKSYLHNFNINYIK